MQYTSLWTLLKSKTNDPTLHIAPKDATVSVASFGENLVLSIIQSTSTNVHVVQAERRAIYPPRTFSGTNGVIKATEDTNDTFQLFPIYMEIFSESFIRVIGDTSWMGWVHS